MLKNESSVLPIRRGKVAVIGPNAKNAVITGGGSARLRPAWCVTPWQGLVDNKPDEVDLRYTLGCKGSKFLPVFGEEFTSMDGITRGFDMLHYAIVDGKQASQPAVSEVWTNSDIMLADFNHPNLGDDYFTEIRALFTAPITGDWQFEISVTGQAWVYIDDRLLADLSKEQKRTSSFFGNGGNGTVITFSVTKGKVCNESYRSPSIRVTHVQSGLQIPSLARLQKTATSSRSGQPAIAAHWHETWLLPRYQ
jgi:beta-glucosidase